MPATKLSCLPPLQWDDELAEVAQVWADQCAMILYKDLDYPKILHEKSVQRTTSQFGHPPGVGQNVAWALTEDVNFTQIIEDLWYRDIRTLEPGIVDSFSLDQTEPGAVLVTQMLWGHTTHMGCGWLQIEVGPDKWADTSYPGNTENFFVCNYGVGGNVPGQPVYSHPDCEPGESLSASLCVHLETFRHGDNLQSPRHHQEPPGDGRDSLLKLLGLHPGGDRELPGGHPVSGDRG